MQIERCYYIIYQTPNDQHWIITKTEHDLDTVTGLSAWIKEQSAQVGAKVFVYNWKELQDE